MSELNDNLTAVMDDVFKDAYVDWSGLRIPEFIETAFDLILFFTALVGVAASLFVAVTILRFKRLRTRTNAYICTLSFLFTCYHLALPVMQIIYMCLQQEVLWCWALHLRNISLTMTFIVSFFMLLEWTLSMFRCTYLTETQKIHKYILGLALLLGLVIFILQGVQCYNIIFIADGFMFRICYTIICCLITVLDIIIAKTKVPYESKKTMYVITMANLYVFSWSPLYIVFHAMNHAHYKIHPILFLILEILGRITVFLVHAYPILGCYLLGRLNNHFKMAFARTFKGSSYVDNDLDINSEELKRKYVRSCYIDFLGNINIH